MKRSELARNLAHSITLGSWSHDAVQANLIRRLPPPLHRLAPGLANDLLSSTRALFAPHRDTVARRLLSLNDFERAFLYCQRRTIWPGPDLTSPVMAPIAAFSDVPLPQLPTVDALADWLFLPVERLEYLADATSRHEDHGEPQVNHYRYYLRRKTNGYRVLEAPKVALKTIQRRILSDIIDKAPNHPDAFGFVKGRNCLQAANRHAGEAVVVSFDLEEFFPSVGAGRVFGLFRCLGYPQTVAHYLTAFCTTQTPERIRERLPHGADQNYRMPHLPQGSPVSPALANHVAFKLDRRLAALARHIGARYSRYADDLTFSGDHEIAARLVRLVPHIVRDEGFRLNTSKTRVMPKRSRQAVTGLVVNQHLNVDRKSYDRLKAIIHACGKPGDHRLKDPRFRASLLGKVDWVETVNPRRGQKLRRLLLDACKG